VKARHRKVLDDLFATPTPGGIIFSEIEHLVVALGGEVREGEGSRVVFELRGSRQYLHRPHPGKEARRYQVEGIREWLSELGVE
jgi:hypothetical protein